jgi:hypothetical protein
MYWPDTDNSPIPSDLKLNLVEPSALQISERHNLFSLLGVGAADKEEVLKRIVRRYSAYKGVRLQDSISHLRYLYWHHDKNESSLREVIYLFDQDEKPIYRKHVTLGGELIIEDVYFKTDGKFEAGELSKRVDISKPNGTKARAPGFNIPFLNSAYLSAVSTTQSRDERPWPLWLEEYAQVQSVPRLLKPKNPDKRDKPDDLSDLFNYIVKYRPDALVETLKQHWATYSSLLSEKTLTTLSKAKVDCGGSGNLFQMTLHNTYLSVPSLIKRCEELRVSSQFRFSSCPWTWPTNLQLIGNFWKNFKSASRRILASTWKFSTT